MEPRPKYFKNALHEIAVVFLVCMAQFITQGNVTLSLSTMNIILASLSPGSEVVADTQKVWFMGSFALTVGTFILLSGKFGDLFGFRRMIVIGWVWIAFWCLITGLSVYSKSVVFFIICRAFCGIGFAILIPCGMGLLGNLYALGSRKNLVFGLIGANGPVGASIGAIMGAVIAQKWCWPWVFWLMSIFAALFAAVLLYYLPPSVQELPLEPWKQLDVYGSIVGISGLILLNFTWNQGPVVGWDSAYIIVLLIVSVFLIIGFFFIEFHVEHPLLPRSVFNKKIGLVLLCIGLGWGSFGVWQFYYWNIILNLRHYSPIMAGLTYIPFLVLGVLASVFVSIAISRTKPSYIISFASVCFMGGCIMLSVMPVDQSYFRIAMGTQFILSWAMDMSFPAAAILLSDFLPQRHQGMAGSLVSTVINYSVSLFLGMGVAVEIEVSKRTDTLSSYRAALHFGTGVAALGVLFSFVFIWVQNGDQVGTFAEKDVVLDFDKESILVIEKPVNV